MHGKTFNALLGYGLGSDLIDKIACREHTLTELRALSRQKLLLLYTSEEVDQIKVRIERTPIPEDVIAGVMSKAGGVCCYCGDGNSTRPFQIHHVDPYSATQDNSEDNLLLVCPTHHAWIHANGINCSEQRSERRRWHAIIEIASDFRDKGMTFPFGAFQPFDYNSYGKPGELVEFGPLSPSTALICYPADLAATARARLESTRFLLVFGSSGSGKTTYATALGGLYAKDGFRVFRHRFDKHQHDSLPQVSLFVSTCVQKAVVILDDANVWASAADLQQIAKLVAGLQNIRVIATWTVDDSEDESKLQAADLAKQILTWSELQPTVVETLLKHEGEIVEALQKFEPDRSIGSLGLGSLHSRLEDRIRDLGDRPNTVYEFVFGLRGDAAAVAEELRQLLQDDRSDVPVLHVAIEQIAGFERPTSLEETVAACRKVEDRNQLPPASPEWVRAKLDRQVRSKRLVRVRDCYTTIHRKWAARLIAAGLNSVVARPTTELLLEGDFQITSAQPERLLRLWSWLRSLDESRPFVKSWARSVAHDDWSTFLGRCAQRGIREVGFLAERMHLLFDGQAWTVAVAAAFERNFNQIATLVYSASPTDWYWLQRLSMAMEHACPDAWRRLLQGWDRNSVSRLLLETPLNQFESVGCALSKARELCPGWLDEVRRCMTWEEFSPRISLIEAGDVSSLFEAFAVFLSLGHKLRRSMLRMLTEAMKAALETASLDNLRLPTTDANLMLLTLYFPDDARSAFAALNVQDVGRALGNSLPRHWRTLFELGLWTTHCGSDVSDRILRACDTRRLQDQLRRYGPSNAGELRLLLHFIRSASAESRRSMATKLRDVVRFACEQRDSEARAIVTAYLRLDADLGAVLATELGIVPEEIEREAATESLEACRQQFRAKDSTGEDYVIDLGEHESQSHP